jgi:hypothetical protein
MGLLNTKTGHHSASKERRVDNGANSYWRNDRPANEEQRDAVFPEPSHGKGDVSFFVSTSTVVINPGDNH